MHLISQCGFRDSSGIPSVRDQSQCRPVQVPPRYGDRMPREEMAQ